VFELFARAVALAPAIDDSKLVDESLIELRPFTAPTQRGTIIVRHGYPGNLKVIL
jgi:hypothetical protein